MHSGVQQRAKELLCPVHTAWLGVGAVSFGCNLVMEQALAEYQKADTRRHSQEMGMHCAHDTTGHAAGLPWMQCLALAQRPTRMTRLHHPIEARRLARPFSIHGIDSACTISRRYELYWKTRCFAIPVTLKIGSSPPKRYRSCHVLASSK